MNVPDKAFAREGKANQRWYHEALGSRPRIIRRRGLFCIVQKAEGQKYFLVEKRLRNMIKINNLTKVFDSADSEVTALKGIDLHVHKGDIYGIIGMSGAGKSTLLRCIALLENPTEGSIEVNGSDISTLKGKELIQHRKQIGVIFQGYNLLMQRTVRDNVAFPLELSNVSKDEIKKITDRLLEIVGLGDKADFYPSQLSGGQKQRVAIARALANDPKVLLCDEPTSALDSLTTKSILELLKEINKKLGVTIIIITHEIGVVKSICNKVAVIDSGSFVETGDTKKILTDPESPITRLLLGMTEVKG